MMICILKFVATVIIVSFVLTIPALAQMPGPPCNDRAKVLDQLAAKYKEAPVAAGITNSGGLIEVLSDSVGGTWTIILTIPGGTTCLIAAGEGWQSINYKLDGPRV